MTKNRKELIISWQRLVLEGESCSRCRATEAEVEKAVVSLKSALAPLGVEVVLEKKSLAVEEFKRDTLESNMIRLNGRLLEEWLEAKAGKSQCCDVCGSSDCRTVNIKGEIYETIPSEIIIKAGLLVAAELIGQKPAGCCPR